MRLLRIETVQSNVVFVRPENIVGLVANPGPEAVTLIVVSPSSAQENESLLVAGDVEEIAAALERQEVFSIVRLESFS